LGSREKERERAFETLNTCRSGVVKAFKSPTLHGLKITMRKMCPQTTLTKI
jgi:hypothetical protein